MPVWIEPRGSLRVKVTAFLAYLRAMQERCEYHYANTDDADTRTAANARAETYATIAKQIEPFI